MDFSPRWTRILHFPGLDVARRGAPVAGRRRSGNRGHKEGHRYQSESRVPLQFSCVKGDGPTPRTGCAGGMEGIKGAVRLRLKLSPSFPMITRRASGLDFTLCGSPIRGAGPFSLGVTGFSRRKASTQDFSAVHRWRPFSPLRIVSNHGRVVLRLLLMSSF